MRSVRRRGLGSGQGKRDAVVRVLVGCDAVAAWRTVSVCHSAIGQSLTGSAPTMKLVTPVESAAHGDIRTSVGCMVVMLLALRKPSGVPSHVPMLKTALAGV